MGPDSPDLIPLNEETDDHPEVLQLQKSVITVNYANDSVLGILDVIFVPQLRYYWGD